MRRFPVLALALVAGALLAPAARADVLAAYDRGGDIALVDLTTGAPVALPPGVNTLADESHPSLSSDGSLLSFERAGQAVVVSRPSGRVVFARAGVTPSLSSDGRWLITPGALTSLSNGTSASVPATGFPAVGPGRHPLLAWTDGGLHVNELTVAGGSHPAVFGSDLVAYEAAGDIHSVGTDGEVFRSAPGLNSSAVEARPAWTADGRYLAAVRDGHIVTFDFANDLVVNSVDIGSEMPSSLSLASTPGLGVALRSVHPHCTALRGHAVRCVLRGSVSGHATLVLRSVLAFRSYLGRDGFAFGRERAIRFGRALRLEPGDYELTARVPGALASPVQFTVPCFVECAGG